MNDPITVETAVLRLKVANLDADLAAMRSLNDELTFERSTLQSLLDGERAETQRLRGELEKAVPEQLSELRNDERKLVQDAFHRMDEAVRECERLRRDSDAIKHSMLSVLRALGLGDHVRPQSWSEIVSDEIVPAIEKMKAAFPAWQATIDRVEDENAKLQNSLRLALVLQPPTLKPEPPLPDMEEAADAPIPVPTIWDRVTALEREAEDLRGLQLRVATLEGKVQGILEVGRLNAQTGITRELRPASNPFEQVRPPRNA